MLFFGGSLGLTIGFWWTFDALLRMLLRWRVGGCLALTPSRSSDLLLDRTFDGFFCR